MAPPSRTSVQVIGTTFRRNLERRLHLGRREWRRAQPRAGRLEDRAGDRRRHDGAGGLPAAPWNLFRSIDEIDQNVGDLGKSQNRIARPVEARHHGAVEGHLFLERAAHGLYDAALDLIAQSIRIDDLPAVVRNVEAFDRELTGLAVDLNLGNDADVGADQFVIDIGKPASSYGLGIAIRLWPLAPITEAGHAFENLLAPGIVEILQANVQRIDAELGRDLIDEGLVCKGVLQPSWRSDPCGPKRGRRKSMRSRGDIRELVWDRQVIKHPAGTEFPEAIESGKVGACERHEAGRA